MHLSTLLLTPLIALAAAAPLSPRDTLKRFHLSASNSAPANLASLGDVSFLGPGGVQSAGGPLGWFTVEDTVLRAFIQYNAASGIAFDGTNTARTVYLKERVSGDAGQGKYAVLLGNPKLDKNPERTHEKNFTITPRKSNGETTYWFGFEGAVSRVWSACETADEGWRLYFGGDVSKPKKGCTKGFSLKVTYYEEQSPI